MLSVLEHRDPFDGHFPPYLMNVNLAAVYIRFYHILFYHLNAGGNTIFKALYFLIS